MKHYTVASLWIHDAGWTSDYVEAVTPLVEAAGGRYLARTTDLHPQEGPQDPPPLMVLIEWPSREAALEFYDSPDYRPYRQMRQAGSHAVMSVVAGVDSAGLATGLPRAQEPR